MSLTQPQQQTPAPPASPALETGLRLALAAALTLAGGVALGGWTFHEIAGRGTGYFVGAAAGAIGLCALAFYRWEWCVAGFVALAWLGLGRTPDMAQGVSSGTGKGLFPVELGLTFLLTAAVLKRLPRVRTPWDGPLVVYLCFCAWTAWNGALFWDNSLNRFYAGFPDAGRTPPAVTILEMALRVLSVGAFYLGAGAVRDGRTLRRVCLIVLLPGALTALSFLHLCPPLPVMWGQLLEIGTACGLLAWLLETAATDRRTRLLRVAAWLALCAIAWQVFYIGLSWITGWLGLFAGLLCVVGLKSRRLLAGSIAGLVVVALCAVPFFRARVLPDVQTSGDLDRFQLLRGDILYALHWPLGIGVGNFRAYNLYYGQASQWGTTTYTSAHNFYGQALAEMGFGGLLVTAVMVVWGWWMLARWYRQMPPGFGRTFVMAAAGWWGGVCVAGVVGDYVVPVYHNGGLASLSTTVYTWLAVGLAAAQAREAGLT